MGGIILPVPESRVCGEEIVKYTSVSHNKDGMDPNDVSRLPRHKHAAKGHKVPSHRKK